MFVTTKCKSFVLLHISHVSYIFLRTATHPEKCLLPQDCSGNFFNSKLVDYSINLVLTPRTETMIQSDPFTVLQD